MPTAQANLRAVSAWRNDALSHNQPCGKPSSNSSLSHQSSVARIAENGFATSSGVSKSAKVVTSKPSVSLMPGRCIYAGSANGPGGLKARVSRHTRRAKRRRWHIDQLTENGDVLGAWIFPGGVECDLVDMNSALPVPIVGFGSTDCQRLPQPSAWADLCKSGSRS